ncbi:MAG: amino acid ABC transporter permease [Anaerolineales bacterium]|jgi:polar amino acid transport system permease protein
MTAESLSQPLRDPDSGMGLELMAHERKERLIQRLKVTLVWVGLVILLVVVLLQLRFDPAYVLQHYDFVLQGALTTIGISVVSILIATVLALLGALGRLSNNSIASGVAGFYVSIVRGTPLLIQIYLIYLGLPQVGRTLESYGMTQLGDLFILSAIQSGVLALSLNYGAYMTEIFRAGIQSIGHGQREAAEAIGMSRWQTLRRIVLPQAVRIIIPDIGNQFIAMQKDSALVSVMGIWEITYRANRFARKDSKFMEMFLLAAALYWILTIISSWLEGRLEKRMAHAYER